MPSGARCWLVRLACMYCTVDFVGLGLVASFCITAAPSEMTWGAAASRVQVVQLVQRERSDGIAMSPLSLSLPCSLC